jgi:hypothetical protein
MFNFGFKFQKMSWILWVVLDTNFSNMHNVELIEKQCVSISLLEIYILNTYKKLH